MTNHRERAVELLVNYFQGIAAKAGMKWDADYTVEIAEAVDHIVDAADGRLTSIERRLAALERSKG